MMTFSAIRGAQIIDVTKECTFEWYQEPSSCYAYLEVSGASGDFTDDETVTGQNSGATATVFSSYVDGGRVYVTDVSGTFQAGETITGSSSNQTATVDGFVAERNYPDNIIQGIFPDSIISKDLNDYLEWESTRTGSGGILQFRIYVPEDGFYTCLPLSGKGIQVDSKLYRLEFYLGGQKGGSSWYYAGFKASTIEAGLDQHNIFSDIHNVQGFVHIVTSVYPSKPGHFTFKAYQVAKGTARIRIHNIRVLKLVI